MANYALAGFLLVYALITFGLGIPIWVAGLLAVGAGILLVAGK